MKKRLFKKNHLAFLISILIFSAIPALVNGQALVNDERRCPSGHCPNGQVCLNGHCVNPGPICNCRVRPVPFQCGQICGFKVGSENGVNTHISHRSEPGNVSAKIFDMTGRLVKVLVNNEMQAGRNQLEWNTKDENINAGVYFLKIVTKDYSETKSLVIVK